MDDDSGFHLAEMTPADEALEQLEEREIRAELQDRHRRAASRSRRQELLRLAKRHALIGNTIAPGTPVPRIFVGEPWTH